MTRAEKKEKRGKTKKSHLFVQYLLKLANNDLGKSNIVSTIYNYSHKLCFAVVLLIQYLSTSAFLVKNSFITLFSSNL